MKILQISHAKTAPRAIRENLTEMIAALWAMGFSPDEMCIVCDAGEPYVTIGLGDEQHD